MRGWFGSALALALAALPGCTTVSQLSDAQSDVSTSRTGGEPDEGLPTTYTDFRQFRIDLFAKEIKGREEFYRSCPPGTRNCRGRLAVGGMPALRGSTPWMAQITLPENWRSSERGLIAADDWEERHHCGAALVAPGWAVTAAHCVDTNMVTERWRVRVGMTNLALDDGRYFVIDRIICYREEYCRYPRPDPLYRDDIALVHFTVAPGELETARDPREFENIGIEAVQLRADEGQLATWSEDGTLRQWDIASGAELTRTDRASAEPAPGPDPATLMVAEESVKGSIDLPASARRLSWQVGPADEDGNYMTRLEIRSIDQPGAAPLETTVAGAIVNAAFAEETASLVVSSEGPDVRRVTGFDLRTLRALWSVDLTATESDDDFRGGLGQARVQEVNAGRALVSNQDEVLVIDAATGAVLNRWHHPRSPAWNDPQRVAVQRNRVSDARFSPDGRFAITATNRYGEADAWLWDLASGNLVQRFAHDEDLLSEELDGARVVQGGRTLFTWTNYGTYRSWDVASGQQLGRMPQHLPFQQVHLLRQDTIAAISDTAGISNWNLLTGQEVSRFDHLRDMAGFAVSPDQTHELSWGADGTARVWSIDAGHEALRIYHNGQVNGATFMADPQRILSWSDDGTARITQVSSRHIDMVFDLGLYPPGTPLAPPVVQRPPRGVEVSFLPIAPPGTQPAAGTQVEIFGWGKTQQPGGFAPFASLMKVDLTVLANQDCAALPGMDGRSRVHQRIFCARDMIQKTCKGDSGGPVVQDGVLMGVVSWGKRECTYDGNPGVYTRISAYSEWIRQQVGADTMPPVTDQQAGSRTNGAN